MFKRGLVAIGLAGGLAIASWQRAWGDETPAATAPVPAAVAPAIDDYELFKIFADTLDQVQRNYVQDVSRRELIEAAIQGMLAKLEDPYSSYISPEDISRFKTSVESRFGGIGIQVEIEAGQLRILSPLRGTPAYRAGLIAGDRIVEIEGTSTEGISIDEAVSRLKGEAGTTVTIGVLHPQATEVQRFTLTREVIEVETVLGDRRLDDDRWDYMLDHDKKIGYIRVTAFSRNTAEELAEALESLTAQGLKGLVLDLRFNPGGLLSSAIEISDLFVPAGRIVSTEGRNSAERVWDAREEGSFTGFPMVVLVNRYSASASEIVSACLQDHGRAIVVGERTWGKGSVQNVIELEGGKSALKLTTASYKRPSGEKIHRFPEDDEEDRWGVMPNDGFKLVLEPTELRALIEDRRLRDILKPHPPAAPLAVAATDPAATDPAAETPPSPTDAPAESPPAGDSPPAAESPATDEAAPADAPKPAAPTAEDQTSPSAGDGSQPAPAESPQTAGKEPTSKDDQPPPFVDRQLAKALDYLSTELARAE